MIQPQAIDPIPSETVRVAHAAFPKGNLYMTMRYEIGTFYNDQDFEALFPPLGPLAFILLPTITSKLPLERDLKS